MAKGAILKFLGRYLYSLRKVNAGPTVSSLKAVRELAAPCFSERVASRHVFRVSYSLLLLRDLRGRPTLRFFTASKSFGSISHIFPTLVAFKRPLAIIFRTRLEVTFKRFAASAALISFMAQV
jgi:hypothetical protein